MELMEANKELEAFNRSVSHDLQTPLMIIGGFARRFLKAYGDKLDIDEVDMINTIQINAQKMERLIKDLLAFSRSGRHEIKSVKIDMGNLIRTVLDELKTLLEGRMIKFDIKTLPPAYGDMGLMKQVLVNLLSNAIKFTKSKDTAVIEVGCGAEDNENIYYVKDNGIGFYPQYSDKLFSPFYRLPEAKEFDGTGIGLSIAQRIINRHGGRIWAEGKINDGATFYFSLPMTSPHLTRSDNVK
jgi:two-component system sensor kinase